jgi:hypothetical protein
MSLKITVELTCSGCHRKLSLKGREVHGRRSNSTYVDDLWVIETGYEEGVSIQKGPDTDSIREKRFEAVCCSIPCILKCLPKSLEKYAKEKAKEVAQEEP